MNLINGLHITNDKSNSGKAGMTMAEAYYYFAGQNPRSGNNKVKTDYTGNTAGTVRPPNAVHALPETRCPVGTGRGPPYNSPRPRRQLRPELHHLHQQRRGAGRQLDNRPHDLDAAPGNMPSPKPATRPRFRFRPAARESNLADEWARFMEVSPYGITTYTVDVNKVTTGQGPGWTALLKSMAGVSRGQVLRRQLRRRRRSRSSRRSDHLLRDPGCQHRLRLSQLAGERQHGRHVPQPGLYRHVPPR